MADTQIGVGIIGVEPGRSWSAVAHIPALRSLPQYRLAALSTRRQESADAAARAFGVEHAFDNHHALVSHPEVDLVVVSVKVPHHLELVSAAIAAGKSVYSEWPLGNGLDEAIRMADLARGKPLSTSVGLQARFSPVLRYVRDLIAEGHIGEVLSTTLIGNGHSWGASVPPQGVYWLDRRNGATLLTVTLIHAIEGLCYVLGEITEVQALTAQRRPHSRRRPSCRNAGGSQRRVRPRRQGQIMPDVYQVLFDDITQGSPNSAEHTMRYLRRYPQFRDEIIELAEIWRAFSIIEALLPPPEPDPVGDKQILWRAQVEFRALRRGRAKDRPETSDLANGLRLVDEQGRRFAMISRR